jgi:diguanylate cyclase (GGDEF)-like protein
MIGKVGDVNMKASRLKQAISRPSIAGSALRKRDFFLPLAVIAGLTLLTMTLGVHFAVRAFDRASEIREQTLAQNGITQRIGEVAQMIVPQADWDDTVRNLDNSYNAQWAQDNIGKFLAQTDGFDQSFILDRDNRLIFASSAGELAPLASYAPLAPLARRMVASVRQQEVARGPFKPVTASKGMISRPIQSSALKLLHNRVAIVTATLVQPDFGTALPVAQRAPVIVTTMLVDGPFLDLFAERFLLDGLHVRQLDQRRMPGETEIPAKDERGNTIAAFAWRPLNPGYTMLRQLVPPILAVCLALAIIAVFQLRRILRMAGQLIEREAASRGLAYRDALTGLPNQNDFEEHLAWELSDIGPGQSVSLHYIRLLDLWQVSEKFGCHARDELIRIVSSRLAALCRSDSLLAHVSRDSFAVVSITNHAIDAQKLAERLGKTLASPLMVDGCEVKLHYQLGTAVSDKNMDPAEMMHEAELAAHQGRREIDHLHA